MHEQVFERGWAQKRRVVSHYAFIAAGLLILDLENMALSNLSVRTVMVLRKQSKLQIKISTLINMTHSISVQLLFAL